MDQENSQSSEEKLEELQALLNAIFRSYDIFRIQTRKNEALLNKNYNHVGKVISCHLLIENLINKWLTENNLNSKSTLRKTFNAKLELLPKSELPFLLILPGIKQLQEIRNSLAHDIHFNLSNADTCEMDLFLFLFNVKDPQEKTIEERIELFTNVCVFAFTIVGEEIKGPWNKLKEIYPNFNSGSSSEIKAAWFKNWSLKK